MPKCKINTCTKTLHKTTNNGPARQKKQYFNHSNCWWGSFHSTLCFSFCFLFFFGEKVARNLNRCNEYMRTDFCLPSSPFLVFIIFMLFAILLCSRAVFVTFSCLWMANNVLYAQCYNWERENEENRQKNTLKRNVNNETKLVSFCWICSQFCAAQNQFFACTNAAKYFPFSGSTPAKRRA